MVVISVYTYGVKIIKKFRWESGFLWGGFHGTPLCTNGSAGYLMQLSVKGTNGRQKTYAIFHVYYIFYSGFMCPTTVFFGITKDGSLVLNTLAS